MQLKSSISIHEEVSPDVKAVMFSGQALMQPIITMRWHVFHGHVLTHKTFHAYYAVQINCKFTTFGHIQLMPC